MSSKSIIDRNTVMGAGPKEPVSDSPWAAYDHATRSDAEVYEDRAKYLEARLVAVCQWLEIHQPDVFSRGLWDAVEAATSGHQQICSG